ncbi:DUF2167 domain-containing protein [Thalassotalea castellviae]|uniref:DUF2167 domain-containing protein n=1 Tax=Thalassotalea castellviae TaxID=3075612 RepID=A0ABU3A5X9_9GAMM|nr:DUF2167 domain-containing protein [Thalassotalea sp. W431]MDT0605369.1 DUF2167 domain-containing protein [Thalassotalea sp. W431]
MKILTFLLSIYLVQASANQEEIIAKLQALNWQQEPRSYSIANDQATVTTTENDFLVIGEEASKYMFITQGHKNYQPDAAILRIQGPEADSQVIYTINKIGYLTQDDWADNIDKDQMLEEIKEGTIETNKLRGDGYLDIFVDAWAQEPFLDKENNTVYWAISGHDSENNGFINAKALKLGREGYTEILWIGSPDQFTSSEVALKPILENYYYSEGFRYADYIPGQDGIAAAGVGALVYKLATGKAAAKAGVLAAAVIFAKKFWFILFLPFVYGWKWLKKKWLKNSELKDKEN